MRAIALVVLWAFMSLCYAGERLSGSNVDVRTTIAFKVPDAAVQKLVPEGWQISSPQAGPLKGFNLALVLIDSIFALDAEGKPVTPTRSAVVAIPAKKKGTEATVTMVVYGISVREGSPGAYGVYAPGQADIDRKVSFASSGKSSSEEVWAFKADDGNSLEVRLQYQAGANARAKLEANTYSGARPDFFRIYRWEQLADMVRSTPTGVDRMTAFSMKAGGSRLAPLFDGSEQVIGVISIPWYSRTVFLPD